MKIRREEKDGIIIEYGHTMDEYDELYGLSYENGDLWDFSKKELEDGSVEPQKGMVYWAIKDSDGEERLYETELEEAVSKKPTSKELDEETLDEGTSNFPIRSKFPLLVFYTYDEFFYNMTHDPDYPQEEQFENERENGDFYVDWDAFEEAKDAFEQKYCDENDICVLTEDDQENLESKLDDFNDETNNIANNLYDADNDDDYYALKDIELKIEPGYYEAAYIDVDGEEQFEYMSEDVAKEQLERFNNFFKELKKEFGLTQLSLAYHASNGETGFNIIKDESLEESKKKYALVVNGEWYSTHDTYEEAQKAQERFLDAINNDEDAQKEYGAFANVEIKEVDESLEEKKKKKEPFVKVGTGFDLAKDTAMTNHMLGSDCCEDLDEYDTDSYYNEEDVCIYQFPRSLTRKDLIKAKDFGLTYLGRVNDLGYQPKDHLVKGKYKDLKRYCSEYLDYVMHPYYLYKEGDIDLEDILEPANESLKEGYVGQEVDDFLGVIIEPELIETLVISNIDADDYTEAFKGSFDDLGEDLKHCDYADFDVGGDVLCVNVSLDANEWGDTYYDTLESLLDDYNGDEVRITDVETGDTLFEGDKSDVDGDLMDATFISLDTPNYLCVNAHCGIDESLKEGKKKSHYEEIEFFPGDEGDLDAEDYIEENGLKDVSYEWDDYRKGYVLYRESLKEEKQHDGKCPFCGSENIDFVDSDEDSEKHVCHDCGKDFLVHDDGHVTTRNNRPIEEKKSKKISYEDALAKLNSGDWDNERFNDAIMDGEVEMPEDESLEESCSDKELVDKLVAFGTCDSEEEAEKRVAKMSQEMKDEMCKSLKKQAQDHLLNDSLNESSEVARVEYCVMDKDDNNIECFNKEEEAIEWAKAHKGVRVLEVSYGPRDEYDDEEELGAEEVWSTIEEGSIEDLQRELGKKLLPPQKKVRPKKYYEIYWYAGEDEDGNVTGDPIFKTFSTKAAAQKWYDAHKDDEDKFQMDGPNEQIDESLNENSNSDYKLLQMQLEQELKNAKKRGATPKELREIQSEYREKMNLLAKKESLGEEKTINGKRTYSYLQKLSDDDLKKIYKHYTNKNSSDMNKIWNYLEEKTYLNGDECEISVQDIKNILKESLDESQYKVGDRVKVKPSISLPNSYAGRIGIIKSIVNNSLEVKFDSKLPQNNGKDTFLLYASEVEPVKDESLDESAIDKKFSKKDAKAIIDWWKEVEDANDAMGWGYRIEGEDYDDIEGWHSAMYDMLVDLKELGASDLFNRGKKLYNKYAWSKYNESLEESSNTVYSYICTPKDGNKKKFKTFNNKEDAIKFVKSNAEYDAIREITSLVHDGVKEIASEKWIDIDESLEEASSKINIKRCKKYLLQSLLDFEFYNLDEEKLKDYLSEGKITEDEYNYIIDNSDSLQDEMVRKFQKAQVKDLRADGKKEAASEVRDMNEYEVAGTFQSDMGEQEFLEYVAAISGIDLDLNENLSVNKSLEESRKPKIVSGSFEFDGIEYIFDYDMRNEEIIGIFYANDEDDEKYDDISTEAQDYLEANLEELLQDAEVIESLDESNLSPLEKEVKDFVEKLGPIEDVRFEYIGFKDHVGIVPFNSEYDKIEQGEYNHESEDRALNKLKEEFEKAGYRAVINHDRLDVYKQKNESLKEDLSFDKLFQKWYDKDVDFEDNKNDRIEKVNNILDKYNWQSDPTKPNSEKAGQVFARMSKDDQDAVMKIVLDSKNESLEEDKLVEKPIGLDSGEFVPEDEIGVVKQKDSGEFTGVRRTPGKPVEYVAGAKDVDTDSKAIGALSKLSPEQRKKAWNNLMKQESLKEGINSFDGLVKQCYREYLDKLANHEKGEEDIEDWDEVVEWITNDIIDYHEEELRRVTDIDWKLDTDSGFNDLYGHVQYHLSAIKVNESLKEALRRYKIEYWVDEEARDQGLGDIAIETFDDLEDAKEYADKLFSDVASVEVLDTQDKDNVVYGRYPEDESMNEGGPGSGDHRTAAQRYNDRLHATFRRFDEMNNKMAQFLLDNGVESAEVEELKKNTGLHGNALHQKLIELGLQDEFFGNLNKKQECKESKNYKAWSIKADALKEEVTILLKNEANVWEEFAQVENCPTKDMLKEDIVKTYSPLIQRVLKENNCKILKEEKQYCIHLKVKDANGKVIKEEDLTPCGTKKEMQEKKKQLEEVSPEDSQHNRNFYSIKEL